MSVVDVAMRTEREVAADAVVALIVAEMLPRETATLHDAAAAVGITVEDVRDAIGRHGRFGAQSPKDRPVFSSAPSADPAPPPPARPDPPTPTPPAPSRPAPADSGSSGGYRPRPTPAPPAEAGPEAWRTIACRGCGQLFPATEFVWRLGRMVGNCRGCRARQAIRRGVVADRLRRRGEWLEAIGFEWTAGPEVDGIICRFCPEPIRIGDTIRSEGSPWHLRCSDTWTDE